MARLLLINGPPGIGKSTLGRRWAAEHPATLCCDIDVLRSLIGGWRADFVGAGSLIRPAALAFIGAYLAEGHDVVLPQLLLDEDELGRFESAATSCGAAIRHVMLMDDPDAVVTRFAARSGDDPWHDQVRRIVAEQGGEAVLRRSCARAASLAEARPDIAVVRTSTGAVDEAYRSLVAAFSD